MRNTGFPQELRPQESHISVSVSAEYVLSSQQLTWHGWTGEAGCSAQKNPAKTPQNIKELHWPLSSVLGLNSSSFSSSSLLELSVFPFICSNWSKLTRPTSSKLRLTFERNTSVITQHNHQPNRKMATYAKQNRVHPKACSARGDLQST